MRVSTFFRITAIAGLVVAGTVTATQAVEEGQLVKKDGKWEYYSGEDPGLKYLLLKGIISQEDYDKGLRVLETKERISKPNFSIDVNNGLNIRAGDKFFLKLRLLTQVRYTATVPTMKDGEPSAIREIPRSSEARWNIRAVSKTKRLQPIQRAARPPPVPRLCLRP
jgi:hypothetical protein